MSRDLELAARLSHGPFTEAIAESVVRSNDEKTFMLALARADCPVSLLVDLSYSPITRVRRAVAEHTSVPRVVLQRLAADKDPGVASAARGRVA